MTLRVAPTRSELLALKRKIHLAETGHRLLKMKRDVLIMEMKQIAKETKLLRMELETEFRNAKDFLSIAILMEGGLRVSLAAVSIDEKPMITIILKNVMGVRVPSYSAPNVKKDLEDRGYGLIETSSVIDESAEAYENLVEVLVEYAGKQSALLMLAGEITSLKRRVSTLEHRVIPDLREAHDRILWQREELEREERTRLVWAKKRLNEHALKGQK